MFYYSIFLIFCLIILILTFFSLNPNSYTFIFAFFPRFGRCEQYNVNYTQSKIWQWFDIPLAISKIYKFPRI